ncbi:caprin-1 isoform X2 [Patella vulgata]|uniref:caprin-1 isoform X2 n=1 Tax=Patella vulgata TaxID=6465 RepID=UPI00217FC480|nr:caprin-1 isoform X2 [Patella vulgata]
MPTATEKQVKKTQQEFEDPIKQVLTAVDRKVSNLEKKKAKLEGLKQKLAHGDRLEPPQREAIARYDQVIHNLEFAQELQKQFETISSEVERLQKKRLKKERMEKRVMEMRRVQELIELQSLLDSLGSETVRSDLQTGKHGAVVLTEENLKQLDEFYQLICPSREGTGNYREQTMAASVHLVNLLDSSHKEIVGSTYKQIKDLLTLLNNCGYFEKSSPASEETPEIEQEKVVEEEEEEESSVASVEKDEQEVERAALPLDFTEHVEVKLPPPIVESLPEPAPVPVPVSQDVDNTYDKQPIDEPKERPVQDIVTQGNFNFLQDSMLEFDSPHSDPAIVAVQLPNQPMSCPNTSQNDSRQQSAYCNQAYNDQSTYDDGYTGQSEQSWANSSAYVADESLYQDEMMGNQGSSYPSESIDQNQRGDDNDQKKFTMNAKAPVFTSMYNQGDNSNSRNNSNQSYQGNDGYRGGGNRGYNRDNNYRGRNGRGGTDSANQNGYSRSRGGRGSRGGQPRAGNTHGGGRGGFGRPQN